MKHRRLDLDVCVPRFVLPEVGPVHFKYLNAYKYRRNNLLRQLPVSISRNAGRARLLKCFGSGLTAEDAVDADKVYNWRAVPIITIVGGKSFRRFKLVGFAQKVTG